VKITISGASGLIGRRLATVFAAEGHSVHALSRAGGRALGANASAWEPNSGEPPIEALRDAHAVIHLAGENVAQRWTDEARRRIRESRVAGTRSLVQALSKLQRRPEALICASAVGYYGSRGDEILTEASHPGTGFLPEVCVAWEREAQAAEELGMRVVRLRLGVVLDSGGGALPRMLPAFRWGVGGRLGDGRQWMSWIHLEDAAGLFRTAVLTPISGAVNAVSPNPVTNAEFTRVLARAIFRPAIFAVPQFALKTMLGEMSEVLLASQRAVPAAAEAAGYRFRFPDLQGALKAIF
jgi:uncharacterized protein (TIGR01777 family)